MPVEWVNRRAGESAKRRTRVETDEKKQHQKPNGRIRETAKKRVRHFRDLDVYQNALETALRVYELSKKFPDGDVARCDKKLERAKRNAAGAERLWRIGVLAKVEVEQRALKVIKCETELASARVAQAKEIVTQHESRVASGETTKQELEVAKTALAQLIEAEQKAVAKRETAELEFAEANLRRQQRLLKLGSAHKSDVTNAEEKLAELKAPRN